MAKSLASSTVADRTGTWRDAVVMAPRGRTGPNQQRWLRFDPVEESKGRV